MKPSKFEYVRPATLQEALSALAEAPDDSKVIAGGQSLVPVMNFRLAAPECLIDITRIPELTGLSWTDGGLRVGATTRTRALELSELATKQLPVLAHAASWVGHMQIRNRGTVGGSIAHGDSAAELPAMCVLLDAEVSVASTRGTRRLDADDFFEGMLTTAVESDEILTEVRFPALTSPSTWGFSEYAQRHGDFALAGAACVVGPDEARVVVFGPTDRAMRCRQAEELISGSALNNGLIVDAAAAAAEEISRHADIYSDEAEHRVRIVRPMVERALRQAHEREGVLA
ncbi:xanthine dehydrogenase family protein subunit M [Nocardioides sp. YIM 152315]|uniref:FAD binding domain-containing protein n=1 Tax=Nocardioides sp. YIM 152315 TaxID=3031760 RepID=UPI0023D9B8F2|nr:xanthine dehydrogenase family protein subunit M [Nocardioides sp. YIM 152315]MDF1605826.1 xanthine dehydrogenase family protein subunit M [Nocardioides sp. YIM 152315]